MAKINFPTEKEFAKKIAERALDEFLYDGKSIREWMKIIGEQEPKVGWNNHQIACMLADLFGDACACNYNGIDEWLPKLCDFKDTCCPNPVGVACWEQFLKYSQSRYTEYGYEIKDKNTLQEPKTIPIPENATNGDMIKAMFPNAIFTEYGGRMKCDGIFVCDDGKADLVPLHILETVEIDIDRWNTPYKVEKER